MTLPFRPPTGPQVTPKTLSATGQGGQMNPAYLQMRVPTRAAQPGVGPAPAYPGQQTQPVVTPAGAPKLSAAAAMPQTPLQPTLQGAKAMTSTPSITPAPAQAPQAGGQTLGDVYRFFKSDLENQRKQALAGTTADAAARGVFYGTPLTGSEADINTQYLRGLGQLQAGMYGNEQQNLLARLGLASNLGWQNALTQPQIPGPMDWSSLGAIFGASPVATGQRTGPTVTPKPGVPPDQITPGQTSTGMTAGGMGPNRY